MWCTRRIGITSCATFTAFRQDFCLALRLQLPVDHNDAAMVLHVQDPDESFEEEVLKFCQHLVVQNGEQMGTAKIAIEMARDVGLDQARHVERLANSALMLDPDYRKRTEEYIKGVGSKGR